MKQLIVLAGIGLAIGANAQIAQVTAPTPLMQGVQSELYYPVLSSDGSRMLFSAADYSNLRVYDFDSKTTSAICTEAGAGYGAQFANGTANVLYVAQSRNAEGLTMRQLRRYDVERGTNTNLTEPARFISISGIETNSVATTVDGRRRTIGRELSKAVRTEGSTLYITVNGTEKAYSPVASQAGYLWESLSPDGTKVMFVAAGTGIIITDLNGNIIGRPGNYEAPVWFGNDYIVAQNATDDGHQYSSSQIVLLSLDGAQRQDLTRPETMSMNPAASAAAKKVVYNTIDGRMYEMTVTINR